MFYGNIITYFRNYQFYRIDNRIELKCQYEINTINIIGRRKFREFEGQFFQTYESYIQVQCIMQMNHNNFYVFVIFIILCHYKFCIDFNNRGTIIIQSFLQNLFMLLIALLYKIRFLTLHLLLQNVIKNQCNFTYLLHKLHSSINMLPCNSAKYFLGSPDFRCSPSIF